MKGAYSESAEIAFRHKRQVDINYYYLAQKMLTAAREQGLYIVFATHDVPLTNRIASLSQDMGLGRDAYEIQMLYGIQREAQGRLAQAGRPVRVLISYGTDWFPWFMRRLAERPARKRGESSDRSNRARRRSSFPTRAGVRIREKS